MSTLIVRFHDSSLDSFSWFVDQSDGVNHPVNWQTGSQKDLGNLAKGHSVVVLAIAQQDVYLTSYEIPSKAARQVLSSVEYQIEDQLAQDIEKQHFAIGNQSNNPVEIAVLNKDIMHRCTRLIRKHGLSVAQVIPEMYLCPWSGKEGAVNLIESDEDIILRYSNYQGIKCRPEMSEMMLGLIAADQEITAVNCYLQEPETREPPGTGNYAQQVIQLTADQLNSGSSESINLLQRQFQKTSVWAKLLRSWKWVLGLMLILVAVSSYNKAIALNQLEAQVLNIKATQYELLKDYLPANLNQTDDLKKELISLLKQSQSGTEETNFLELLRQFTKAKSNFSSVIITKIGYQKHRLSIYITSNQLNELESLLEAIESTGQTVKLENLNIKPDIISGQFVLDGVSK